MKNVAFVHIENTAIIIAYVDVEKIIQAVSVHLSNSDLHGEELSKSIELYKQKFRIFLDDYSKACNAVVFAKPSVLSGASDKTEFFIKKLLDS